MEESGLNRYLDEIGRESLLSAEEERALAQKIQQGDSRALNRLVEANLRFVVTIANQYKGKGLQMDDLVSEGNIGLMKAASRFNPDKGTRFVNYAVVHIRQQIEKAIDQQTGLYQVPKDVRNEAVARQQSHPVSVDAPLGHRTNMSLLSVLVNQDAPFADERIHSEAIEDAVKSSELVSEAMVFGEKCKSVYVLVNVAEDKCKGMSQEEITAKIKEEVHEYTKHLAAYQKPRDVLILPAFNQEDGTMTATLKIRRFKIREKYKEQIEAFLTGNGEEIATKHVLGIESSRVIESLSGSGIVDDGGKLS